MSNGQLPSEAARAASSTFRTTNDVKPPSTPGRILVVDDEEIMRSVLTDVLGARGHQVTSCSSAESALILLGQTSFDLVITDIVMPKMDGIELLRRAKALAPDSDFIVITAYASIETAVQSMQLGAADYITKPFNADQIRIVVDKTLYRRSLERFARERAYYEQLSRIDGLTGVLNHRAFHQVLDSEVGRSGRYGHELSLIMIDVDDFKAYNDTYGHQAGDGVLKQLAQIFRLYTRNSDYVARYGGEEFCIALTETGRKGTVILARRLIEIVANTKFNESLIRDAKRVTISAGVASLPTDATNKDELLRKADRALYAAKAAGKNMLCVHGETAHKP
ncbi:MAG: diguanylate cyclase [Planctomycetes bacterium]|nr:diguanylate cyclase [Planctomycetota bacterium]